MGQEASNHVGESGPPQTLDERSLQAVARLIREGRPRKIVVLTGAGISTAAGIPDFRSPGTGLYANLKRLNLPYAEAVFSMDYFRQNPQPFYILAQELYPGRFAPTVSHAFIALLARKGLLNMLFTQNIDCLERAAGVPADRIVEAHGSFATQHCIDCRAPFPDDYMRAHVRDARVPRCRLPGCGGLVKPDIVFFGESLPPRFHLLSRQTPAHDGTDLVLVLGTSLTVYPFAGLPGLAPVGVPRVLINREAVGDLGSRSDDVLVLGSCDAGVLRLAHLLGWDDELDQFWRSIVGDAEADRQRSLDDHLARLPVPHYSDSSSDEEEPEPRPDPKVATEPAEAPKVPETSGPAAVAAAVAGAGAAPTRPTAEDAVNEITSKIEAALSLDDTQSSKAEKSAKEQPWVAARLPLQN